MLRHAVLAAAAACAGADQLGPGDGPWQRDAPELHGLDRAKLDEAWKRLQKEVPNRYCFGVARNGKLVYEGFNEEQERYPGQKNTPNTRYEVDSAGKTMQALMVGVGIKKKLYDLDTPLEKYGVKPQASFGWGYLGWYKKLTLRHILSQTTGQGKAEPGTAFTYDSDAYIAHASHLIEKTSGEGSAKWATDNFAIPLGLPDLYKEDGEHTDIGGGQMMSCADLLRVGQIILNKGKWKKTSSKDGGAAEIFQLVSEEYAKQVMTPQHPKFVRNYGLLTWLNAESKPGCACCMLYVCLSLIQARTSSASLYQRHVNVNSTQTAACTGTSLHVHCHACASARAPRWARDTYM